MEKNEMIKKYQSMLDRSGFIRLLSIRLIELDKDHAKGVMPFDSKYCNPYGSMHGGCIYALADTVTGTLADTAGCDVTTVEGGMNFLEPVADTQNVYCIAEMKKCGRHLITVEAKITGDSGRLLGCGLFTFFRMDDTSAKDGQKI